ncbi:hypothetical protein ACFFNY_10535 [Paenibacillus hodogayensis]|uniref:DUF1080 domain-containing protein n=1 Tax=Paenibacillus hodogayensis TaxID=279208 RepID=A0ABV5VUM2_9BACL
MSKSAWSLTTDLNEFDLNGSGAYPGAWHGREALYIENRLGAPVLLKSQLNLDRYRLQAEIACPQAPGFIGLVFGVRDSRNYELVYVSPGTETDPGEIQYDPVMNGSTTWQINNGPEYQAAAPFIDQEWSKLCLEVQQHEVSIRVGEDPVPQLVIRNLQHGRCCGTIGVWGYLPSYIRNLSVETIEPNDSVPAEKAAGLKRLAAETFITGWTVSEPYFADGDFNVSGGGSSVYADVEENGTLNLNRLFPCASGMAVQASCKFTIPEEKETVLTFGFSDCLRLWVNGEAVYQGDWTWTPPGSDGRIRPDFAEARVRWRAGLNTIRAEVGSTEAIFGWGLAVKTRLFEMMPHPDPDERL